MPERYNPQERQAKERARLIGNIKKAIKSFVQEPPWNNDAIEREHVFTSKSEEYTYEITYAYSEVPGKDIKIKFRTSWIDSDEDSAAEFLEEVEYIFTGDNVVKNGFYDFRLVNGEQPVEFRPGAEKAIRSGYLGSLSTFPSPEVNLRELKLLAKIAANPLESYDYIRKLSSPSNWPKN